MNTEQNINNVNQPVKRGRGRPLLVTATRILRLNPNTKAALGKGRVKENSQIIEIVCHRSFSQKNFQYGISPIISEKLVNFHSKKKDKPPIHHNINIVVTEPSQQEMVQEVAPVGNHADIIHEDMAVS